MFNKKNYSLYKCKKILRQVYKRYKRNKKRLTDLQRERFENILFSLKTSILKKNKKAADRAAKNLENLTAQHLKKTILEQFIDVSFALIFAIAIAIIIRGVWFEPYILPSGSMRPTLKESDLLIVSKTNFSLNVPLTTKNLYFNEDLLNRGSIIIFSSANLDLADSNHLYFYLFPGKKLLVKRLVGKPGDILYFYGGRIYGIDENDNEITELYESDYFKEIEHIPFIRFDGKTIFPKNCFGNNCPIVEFYQMNEPIAMIKRNYMGKIEGELLTEHSSVFTKKSQIKNYFDIWGMKNFAMARMLSEEEVKKYSSASMEDVEKTPLYLELTHHPRLEDIKTIIDDSGRLHPSLTTSQSLVALDEEHLKKITKRLYTTRFCVKNGYAYRYGSKIKNSYLLPKLEGIPNGCYEIQNGKAYKVYLLGIIRKLNKNHPLNKFSIEQTKTLYNLGIEFLTFYDPYKKNQTAVPSRYAYFRNEELYLMGHKIFNKEDSFLIHFLQREYKKQISRPQYLPFEDFGSPFDKTGNLDINVIRKFGIKIPEKTYLVLGDNHAMSADSREFGFVPEDNLRGGACFIFWPPSHRWGKPFQPPFQTITIPKIIVWSTAFIVIVISVIYSRRRIKKTLKF